MCDIHMKTLYNYINILEDTRDIRGKKHKLTDIIIMTIYGVLCGYTDFVNMADFLKLHEQYFIDLLNLENGVPSHDTFSRVFSLIDSKKFIDIFIEWIKDIVKQKGLHVAIDGKAIKSARDKVNNGSIPYILSGFLCDIGLSIGQIKVDDKSNEITAIPELLDLIDVKGKIITIDAIGTQEEIANKIVYEKKAAYILKVKDNQKDLKDDIKTYFDLEIKNDSPNIDILETAYEKNHGRIEKRTYYISYDVNCIHNKKKWQSVKAIGRMDVYREENGKATTTKNYYILSQQFSTEAFKNVTREHWNIECSLHWRLDVILNEDHSTNKKDNSIDNLAIIRKIIFNLAQLDKSMGNLTLKKKLTRYSFDFKNIENLIFKVIPSL
jgi:predicted transposase YbfD/YdcC